MLGRGKGSSISTRKELLPRESKNKTKYIKAIYVKLGSITISDDDSQTKKQTAFLMVPILVHGSLSIPLRQMKQDIDFSSWNKFIKYFCDKLQSWTKHLQTFLTFQHSFFLLQVKRNQIISTINECTSCLTSC